LAHWAQLGAFSSGNSRGRLKRKLRLRKELRCSSCLIDGEAVACDENGLAVFEQLRRKPSGKHVFLYAFDLLELDGQDLRREPLETRKATLASLLRGSLRGLRLNEPRPRWRERISARLQARVRGHRVEAARVALSLRPVEGLAQVQEPGSAGGEARGGGGLGPRATAMRVLLIYCVTLITVALSHLCERGLALR
jgi:hypothetical protein